MADKRKGCWYQYSLRTLLILGTLIAVACSWYAHEMQKTAKIRSAVAKLSSVGGEADYCETSTGELLLRCYKISDADLVHVKDLTNLEFLSLLDTQVTDAGLANLKGLTNLKMLRLDDTRVTDAGLVHLKDLTNLETLNLSRTQITDAGLVQLRGLKKLLTLDLGHVQVSDEGVRSLQEALPNCDIIYQRPSAQQEAGPSSER